MVQRYDEVMSAKASKISLEEFKDIHSRDYSILLNKVDQLNTKQMKIDVQVDQVQADHI